MFGILIFIESRGCTQIINAFNGSIEYSKKTTSELVCNKIFTTYNEIVQVISERCIRVFPKILGFF